MNRARKADNHVQRKKRLSVGLWRKCKVNRAAALFRRGSSFRARVLGLRKVRSVNLSDGRRSCLAADYAGVKTVADALMQNFNYVLRSRIVGFKRPRYFFLFKKANVHLL